MDYLAKDSQTSKRATWFQQSLNSVSISRKPNKYADNFARLVKNNPGNQI